MHSSIVPGYGLGSNSEWCISQVVGCSSLRGSTYNILGDFWRGPWESFAIHDEEVN